MICKKCAVAADIVTIARTENFDGVMILPLVSSSQDKAHIETKEVARGLARMYHGLCKGGTHCDCQHYVVLR